jgi:sulfur carrier protein ThiS|tara:strand:+ start:48 stop:371 length:324 start_codon:yes stop_codon:yes gene_type:complete
MAYASGKYAKAISDRSGMEFPYKEMVTEWNGSFVHKSEFEAKHPQEEPTTHVADGEALKDASPDRIEPVEVLVGNKTFFDSNNSMQPQTKTSIIMRMKVNPVTVSIS